MLNPVFAFIFIAACAGSAQAQVYKCPASSGRTVMQQMPCAGGQELGVKPSGGVALSDQLRQHYAREAARREAHCRGKQIDDIRVGMHWNDVQCLPDWRTPSKINTTETAQGKRSQYVYRRGAVSYYLYFDDDMILRTIQR